MGRRGGSRSKRAFRRDGGVDRCARADPQQEEQGSDPDQAGTEHVQPHQHGRDVREVLDVADDALGQLDTQQHQGGRAHGRQPQHVSGDHGADGETDQDHHQVGVQLGRAGDRQTVAPDMAVGDVARVRAGAGDDRPHDEHERGDGRQCPHEPRHDRRRG